VWAYVVYSKPPRLRWFVGVFVSLLCVGAAIVFMDIGGVILILPASLLILMLYWFTHPEGVSPVATLIIALLINAPLLGLIFGYSYRSSPWNWQRIVRALLFSVVLLCLVWSLIVLMGREASSF